MGAFGIVNAPDSAGREGKGNAALLDVFTPGYDGPAGLGGRVFERCYSRGRCSRGLLSPSDIDVHTPLKGGGVNISTYRDVHDVHGRCSRP